MAGFDLQKSSINPCNNPTSPNKLKF